MEVTMHSRLLEGNQGSIPTTAPQEFVNHWMLPHPMVSVGRKPDYGRKQKTRKKPTRHARKTKI
jgi:hypothetical protein